MPSPSSSQLPSRVWLGEDEGQTALLFDGVVQSVVVGQRPLGPGYWPLMLPEACPRRALILGMGGGTVAHLLMRQFGPVPIVGIESDPRVIELGRSAFGLDLPNVETIEGDAFTFVAQTSDVFDYVAVDLYAGNNVPSAIFGRPFLRRVRQVLSPGGMAAINFFKDKRSDARVQRLRIVFPRVTVVRSRLNLIAHCRPR